VSVCLCVRVIVRAPPPRRFKLGIRHPRKKLEERKKEGENLPLPPHGIWFTVAEILLENFQNFHSYYILHTRGEPISKSIPQIRKSESKLSEIA